MSGPSEYEVSNARMKSYTGSAFIAFFLYWLLWLPGLIANYMFYSEAKRMERTAGQSLPGVGCLSIMLWLNIISVVLGVMLFCILTAIGIGTGGGK